MLRPPSILTRVARLFVGLVTVWCLGCSGYEPLMESLFGAAADGGMSCGGSILTRSVATDAGRGDVQSTVVGVAASHETFDCGCGQSCHAPSADDRVVRTIAVAVPSHAGLDADAPASVARTPLLPPPESRRL